jgi:hypothetical protein
LSLSLLLRLLIRSVLGLHLVPQLLDLLLLCVQRLFHLLQLLAEIGRRTLSCRSLFGCRCSARVCRLSCWLGKRAACYSKRQRKGYPSLHFSSRRNGHVAPFLRLNKLGLGDRRPYGNARRAWLRDDEFWMNRLLHGTDSQPTSPLSHRSEKILRISNIPISLPNN